jgi:extradiol dioxygenase family protein
LKPVSAATCPSALRCDADRVATLAAWNFPHRLMMVDVMGGLTRRWYICGVTTRPGFHLAIPVDDLGEARRFYGEVLGCAPGRSTDIWADWNFYGHQLVTHVVPGANGHDRAHNPVDGHEVPVPHFGLILSIVEFHSLAARLRQAGVEFVIEPYLRFPGEAGEQWTMFFTDPAGNALEFKAFADESQIFAT